MYVCLVFNKIFLIVIKLSHTRTHARTHARTHTRQIGACIYGFLSFILILSNSFEVRKVNILFHILFQKIYFTTKIQSLK